MKTSLALLLGLGLTLGGAAHAKELKVASANITQSEVLQAQQTWLASLTKISQVNQVQGAQAAKQTAQKVLDEVYGFELGPVLFKPTLTQGAQTFRTTKEGALAYFVGQNAQFPSDSGFALNNWQGGSIDNEAIRLDGPLALTMGKVTLVDVQGKNTTVDKTWGFLKTSDGRIKIVLHHSSLPYQKP